jgi:alanine racemase
MALSWLEIDLAALRHNFSQAKQRLMPGTKILGVVKSDAYGHGMVPVARELALCGIDFLAVSKFWEALELRAAGIDLPVLALLGIEPDEAEEAIRLDIRPVVYRLDHARLLSEAARRQGQPVRVHVKVDTGMGRLGVPCAEAIPFLDALTALPGIEIEGILSHFAGADEADKTHCESQLCRFRDTLTGLAERGRHPAYAHISNSAGLIDLRDAHFQLVRPGIMLYGSQPSHEVHYPANLKPVMSFKAKVLQVKDVQAGQSIGYGRTYVTSGPSRIATLPVGYDDGYPRILSSRGQVLIGGKRAQVVGRVSMNMITVDVTDIPGVKEDDEAVLLGRQGDEMITGDELADLCNTINYEIYCNIGRHRFKMFHNITPADTPTNEIQVPLPT